ncbi:MAG: hypothetical protein KA763_00520 [Xanthomonadales bacterium]|nr:hypothetical protein [Xanthomonadales bacterium]
MASPIVYEIPPPPPRPRAAQSITDDEWAHVWRYAYQSAQARVSLMYTVKRWFKSKMMWLGGALTTAGAGLEIAATTLADERALVLQAFGTWGPWALIASGISIKALRLVTSGKLTK